MRRTSAVALALLPLALPVAAVADAPAKTGWWNAATVNGVALPQPTTGADDLRVGQGPGEPSAYAALAFPVAAGVTGGILKLKVVEGTAAGTVEVQACPTKDVAWKPGGNQPYDTRPEYDCAKPARGVAAADGAGFVFALGAAQQLVGGFSVAIVPVEDAAPFTVDFAKPDATAFTPETASVAAEEPAPAPFEPAPPPPPAGTSGDVPLSPGTIAAPPSVQLESPVLPAPGAPAPVAAAAPVAPVTALPVAAVPPPTPVSNRDRYAAGTMLALLAGALVWAFQQPSPQPRLIGGMARKAGPPVTVGDTRPRGIGRFASIRTSAPRPLL